MKKLRLILTLCLSVSYLVIWAQAPFGQGNLLVLKAGNGATMANTLSVPVNVVEYNKAGQVVQTINVPQTGNLRLVLANNNPATIEGFLNLSDDGNYVTFAGYDTEAGISNLQNTSGNPSTGIKRAIGRYDATGAFSVIKGSSFPGGTNSGLRSVVQADKDRAWAAGTANFLRFVDLTSTDTDGSSSTWSTSSYVITNINKTAIFNNQVYFSSASSTAKGLYVVNTASNRFPVSASGSSSATPALVPLPQLGSAPNGFVFFDTNEDAIADLLYIADENEAIGLQKYSYDGTLWTAKGTVQVPAEISEKRLRDLTGIYEDGKYVIYGNTGSTILSFKDEAAPSLDISVTTQILASAGTNYIFRGISFTPGTKKSYPKPESYALRIKNNTDLIGNITSNVTYRKFPGLEETHLSYTDQTGKPMAMFFITVDLANSNIKVEAGMPNGGTTFGVQRVRDQINFKNTARTPDFRVLAATNGDYWDINGEYPDTGTPLGLVYMDGTMVKDFDRSNHSFLSILKDNTAVIGSYADYGPIQSKINYALGGRFYVVRKKDEYIPTGTTDTGTNPRTTVGTLSPTKLIFTVIDGRRADYSIGLTLTEISKLYRALGVTDALNMDGGGSTTLVTKGEGESNTNYQVINSPSDGSPRAVANSWMILGRTNSVTPVNLKSFTAERHGSQVKLNWATASESNNSHFEIYRSDSKEFHLPIGIITGAGESRSLRTYSYIDANPFAGTNYYQLNQVDYDGRSERSDIVAVNTGIQEETLRILKVGDDLQLVAYSEDNTAATIRIATITGRLVSTSNVKLQKGQNFFPLTTLASGGAYILTLHSEGKSKHIKFVK